VYELVGVSDRRIIVIHGVGSDGNEGLKFPDAA
jgi:hypothetical protein